MMQFHWRDRKYCEPRVGILNSVLLLLVRSWSCLRVCVFGSLLHKLFMCGLLKSVGKWQRQSAQHYVIIFYVFLALCALETFSRPSSSYRIQRSMTKKQNKCRETKRRRKRSGETFNSTCSLVFLFLLLRTNVSSPAVFHHHRLNRARFGSFLCVCARIASLTKNDFFILEINSWRPCQHWSSIKRIANRFCFVVI